jgi:hypothetical protein
VGTGKRFPTWRLDRGRFVRGQVGKAPKALGSLETHSDRHHDPPPPRKPSARSRSLRRISSLRSDRADVATPLGSRLALLAGRFRSPLAPRPSRWSRLALAVRPPRGAHVRSRHAATSAPRPFIPPGHCSGGFSAKASNEKWRALAGGRRRVARRRAPCEGRVRREHSDSRTSRLGRREVQVRFLVDSKGEAGVASSGTRRLERGRRRTGAVNGVDRAGPCTHRRESFDRRKQRVPAITQAKRT